MLIIFLKFLEVKEALRNTKKNFSDISADEGVTASVIVTYVHGIVSRNATRLPQMLTV